MTTMKVYAREIDPFDKSHPPCSSCQRSHTTRRLYDFTVTVTDFDGRTTPGLVITLCSDCRDAFDTADLELDGSRMYDDWLKRHPEDAGAMLQSSLVALGARLTITKENGK